MLRSKIEKIYKSAVFTRHDADGTSYLFTEADFEGLMKEEYSFKNQRGERLAGAFYFYEGYRKDRLIVFDHGMSVGHNEVAS